MPICDFFKQQKRSPTLIRVPICNGILWCSLDYSDCINECFYDVWGSFEAELGAAKIFPSLTDLSRIPPAEGDTREVCSPPRPTHGCRAIHECDGDPSIAPIVGSPSHMQYVVALPSGSVHVMAASHQQQQQPSVSGPQHCCRAFDLLAAVQGP